MRLLFFLFASISCFGAYVGNPAAPAIMNTGFFSLHNPLIKGTTGYIADYTSNKGYITRQSEEDFNPDNAFRKFGLHSQMASFSIILLERLEMFGSAGGTKEKVTWRSQPKEASMVFNLHSDYHFSWSTGAKVVLIQWGKTYLSGDFTYFAIPSSPKSFFKFFNRMNLPIDLSKQKFHLREWQASLGLSSRFAFFTPYAGATYLHSRLHINPGPETASLNYKNKNKIGYFYGLTLSITGRFHLNAERRVRDEYGYTFSTIAVF